LWGKLILLLTWIIPVFREMTNNAFIPNKDFGMKALYEIPELLGEVNQKYTALFVSLNPSKK